jgi:hypothetical protein
VQNTRFFAVVIVGVLGLGAFDVGAQTSGSGGGTLTFGQNTPEVVELGGGRSMLRTSNSGAYVADDPASPFHLATQDCRGTVVLTASGDPVGNRGYCDCVDADGDMFWISYANNLDTGSWEILGGTGKFDGMQGAGSVEFLLNLPDGRLVLAWDGSWTMQ